MTQEIIEICAEHYGVTTDEILSESRKVEHVTPRHVAMYLMTKYTMLPLRAIAERLGRTNHGTVINARDNIRHQRQYETGLKSSLEKIETDLTRRHHVKPIKSPIEMSDAPRCESIAFTTGRQCEFDARFTFACEGKVYYVCAYHRTKDTFTKRVR